METEQCKPLLGTCIDKKCTCTPEQHFQYGRCEDKKGTYINLNGDILKAYIYYFASGLTEACSRAGECFIEKEPENVECRNSVCQCKFGYQSDAEQKTCIRVLPNKKSMLNILL